MADYKSYLRVLNKESFNLKEKQKEILDMLQKGKKEIIGILPTGYGKSLIYEIAPLMLSGTVIVISPLTSIQVEQFQRLRETPLKTCILNVKGRIITVLDIEDEMVDMQSSTPIEEIYNTNLIFAHPEAIFNTVEGRKLLDCDSATVSLQEEKDIVKALGMKTPCIVKESPDRTNIYLEKNLKGSSNDVFEMFENIYKPLCDDLFVKKENFPVTLVYIPIQYMGSAIAYCRFIFRNSNLHNCLYGALCSGQDEKVKATILTDLGKKVPRIRLVFCTSVIGMGFNSPSIDCVIHTKPPRNLSDFVQEIGRAGRDGRPARSILFYCKRDISNNVPEIKNDIVQYCNDDTCLRSCMLSQFGFEKGDMIDHECCMYCKESCKCIECEILRIEL
ncbi:recQ [Mytilus edulis]|uniref:DNA 3'-5' helicase n=1 Tax=Mytilus edulis TaxID=6550 RepID=A0A8S3PWJ3_MYTED|nr:recQ [Mytilus edulis]